MRPVLPLLPVSCLAILIVTSAAAGDVVPLPGPVSARVPGALSVELRADGFLVADTEHGQRIAMAGFDYLKEPGRPMLPEREYLLLLPPGARATGLEIEKLDSERLPGNFRIEPTPPLLPMGGAPGAGEQIAKTTADWQAARKSAYASDRAYPEQAARIVGSGTLRKYAYVRVAFRPFTYHARSGRLVHNRSVRLQVLHETPAADSREGKLARALRDDTVADRRAAALFDNHDDVKGLYEPTATARAALPEETEHHDYVIVTTPGLESAVTSSQFIGWKGAIGFDVRIVLTTDDEVAGQPGADLAERLRNFLRTYYGPWGIEYVLLVGNSGVPMRYGYPDPDNHTHDPSDPSGAPGSVPTDAYYADLSLPDDESWDLDGDGFHGEYGEDNPDFLHEVAVGRIPTDDAARVTYTLDKIVRTEKDIGPWKHQALHAGAILFFANQNFMGIPLRDGATCMDEIERRAMDQWTVSRYSEQVGLVPSPYPWQALTEVAFTTDWSQGAYGIVNWAGHGWTDAVGRTIWNWDDGDGVPETDGSDGMESVVFVADYVSLRDERPSIVYAVSCNVGYPEPNAWGNLGIDLLTDPGLGAASAVVAASRVAHVSFDWPAQPGGAESLAYEFNRYLIAGPGGPRRLGDAHHESKAYAHYTYGWDQWGEYRNMYDYNVYGDPAMDWRGVGLRRADLLRSTDVIQLEPLTPPLDETLPLDPDGDLHVADFPAGDVDPDSANGSPLVFYAIDSPLRIWVEKTESGEVRIEF